MWEQPAQKGRIALDDRVSAIESLTRQERASACAACLCTCSLRVDYDQRSESLNYCDIPQPQTISADPAWKAAFVAEAPVEHFVETTKNVERTVFAASICIWYNQ